MNYTWLKNYATRSMVAFVKVLLIFEMKGKLLRRQYWGRRWGNITPIGRQVVSVHPIALVWRSRQRPVRVTFGDGLSCS
jgi:hypothetical protein